MFPPSSSSPIVTATSFPLEEPTETPTIDSACPPLNILSTENLASSKRRRASSEIRRFPLFGEIEAARNCVDPDEVPKSDGRETEEVGSGASTSIASLAPNFDPARTADIAYEERLPEPSIKNNDASVTETARIGFEEAEKEATSWPAAGSNKKTRPDAVPMPKSPLLTKLWDFLFCFLEPSEAVEVDTENPADTAVTPSARPLETSTSTGCPPLAFHTLTNPGSDLAEAQNAAREFAASPADNHAESPLPRTRRRSSARAVNGFEEVCCDVGFAEDGGRCARRGIAAVWGVLWLASRRGAARTARWTSPGSDQ